MKVLLAVLLLLAGCGGSANQCLPYDGGCSIDSDCCSGFCFNGSGTCVEVGVCDPHFCSNG